MFSIWSSSLLFFSTCFSVNSFFFPSDFNSSRSFSIPVETLVFNGDIVNTRLNIYYFNTISFIIIERQKMYKQTRLLLSSLSLNYLLYPQLCFPGHTIALYEHT